MHACSCVTQKWAAIYSGCTTVTKYYSSKIAALLVPVTGVRVPNPRLKNEKLAPCWIHN
jgi:hypothetical protein